MRILDRYLLREHLAPTIVCLATFSMIYVVYDLFDHVARFLEARTPPLLIARYYLYLLAPTFEYIAPASLLLGTLYALWQLTRHGEMTAIRASGVHLLRAALPLAGVGLAASLAVAVLKETGAPAAALWSHVFAESRYRSADSMVEAGRLYWDAIGRRRWLIELFDLAKPNRLGRVEIIQERADRSTACKIEAARAEWLDGEWWLFDGTMQDFHASGEVPVGEPRAIPRTGLLMPSFAETPQDFLVEAKMDLGPESSKMLSSLDYVRYLRRRPQLARRDVAHRLVDLHVRLAMPWACLIVTVFGIPAGSRYSRQSALSGIFLAIGFFMAFYAMVQFAILLGKWQVVEPWLAAWLPNLFFLLAGAAMLWRMR